MRGPERPSPPAPEELRTAVSAVENRGPAAADLPPLQAAAYDAAKAGLRLLKHRARSEHELRQRLLTAEHAADAVDEAVERIRAWGLLDDADFAAEWVRGRRRRRGRSRAHSSVSSGRRASPNRISPTRWRISTRPMSGSERAS